MKPFSISQVNGWLFISNKVWPERDLKIIQSHGIAAIVNLVEDHAYELPSALACLNCSFVDGTYISPRLLDEIYSFIDLFRQRTRVLVHCSAGVSRSAGILAGQLMRENPGWTWKQAIAVIDRQRAVWVSVETQESVLAYLASRDEAPSPSQIQLHEAQALRQLEDECGTRLQEVRSIGWNTQGYVARGGQVVGVGLYQLGLREFPRSLRQLAGLEELYLCGNQIAALPDRGLAPGSLLSLNLSGNLLNSLPAGIGELRRLRVLNLAHNQIQALPDEIGRLHALERLYLHENCLASLPETLGGLEQLVELYLQRNRLAGLPDSLGRLAGLQRLAADGNELASLPESISHLSRLNALSLANNWLVALPSDTDRLANLDNLRLSSNRLEALPESIIALKKLRRLNIALNCFASLPASIEQWLHELDDRGAIVYR